MLLSKIYEQLNLPDKTYLGTRVAKKQLIENSQLSSSDKKAVQEDIEAIIWRNTLKNTTLNISPYHETIEANNESTDKLDSDSYVLEYNEIAVIEVTIRSTTRAKKIAELIQRAIPYPILLVLHLKHVTAENEPSITLNLATKRLSKADHSKLKVERFYQSPAFTITQLNSDSIEDVFLKSLSVENQSFVNFYEFYMGWVKQFLELEKSKHTNEFTESDNQSVDIAQAKSKAKLLDSITSLESRLAGIRKKITQEGQINRKVELNIQAQNIKQELSTLKIALN
jgi:predicted nucleic-acid-binding protein